MDTLKEYTIVETFSSLNGEQQRRLLEQLLMIVGQTTVEIKFENNDAERLHTFCKKKWSHMSIQFFQQTKKRWDYLMDTSGGNYVISCCDIGDLYLQYAMFKDDDFWTYSPFNNLDRRHGMFYQRVFSECNWRFMFISKMEEGDESATNYLISDLMELDDASYKEKMIEFGYPMD